MMGNTMHIHWEESLGADAIYPPATALWTLLERNPFAPIQEMDTDEAGDWQPYNGAAAANALQQHNIIRVKFQTGQPAFLEGDVGRGGFQNNVNLIVSDALVRETDPDLILALMRQVAETLPRFLECRTSADPHLRETVKQAALPNLPAFNFVLGWAHLVSPRGIAPYYLPDDLLQAPAYRVRQLENGLIEMLVYAHPLDYDLPESRQRFIELTRYLAAKRRQ